MKKLLILAISLFGFSAYASIPIIDATAGTESIGLFEMLSSAMDEKAIIAAILCFFLGTLGVHWFYLGKAKKGWIRLGMFLGGYALLIAGIAAASPALIFAGYGAILVDGIISIVDLVNILTGNY